MIDADIRHCSERVAYEERRAREAPSAEAGLVHSQMAMLYKAQLASLIRARRASDQARAAIAQQGGRRKRLLEDS